MAARDEAGYLADWGPSAPAQRLAALDLVYTNLVALGVARIDPSVDEGTIAGPGSTWSAAVNVTWGLTGLDATSSHSEVLYRFSDRDGRPAISGVARVPNGREPIWLLPGLEVRRSSRTLVAATDAATARRVQRLLTEAVGAVTRVLPGWHGDLVAYAPGSQRQFDSLVDAEPGAYRGIAAVTTVVDGSLDGSAPTAIVLNPQVFGSLGPLGAHVVVAHEATHAATHAAAVSMPLWVAEGFADYVGIGSVHVPISVAAAAALRVVRRSGPPSALPADAAFAVSGAGLEASYEEAWLATSLIAKTYGQPRLVAFYRLVEAHPDALEAAFEDVLQTSQPAFTRAWRSYLQGLARAG